MDFEMRNWDWTDIGMTILIVVLIGFTVFAVALFIVAAFTPINCNNVTADIGLPHQWTFWGGCKVFDGGRWIPIDNYNYPIGE